MVTKTPKGEPRPAPSLHPRTPGHRAASHAAALLRAIRAVLRVALASRGTSMRNFVDAEARSGNNAAALLVYGRAGEPCAPSLSSSAPTATCVSHRIFMFSSSMACTPQGATAINFWTLRVRISFATCSVLMRAIRRSWALHLVQTVSKPNVLLNSLGRS